MRGKEADLCRIFTGINRDRSVLPGGRASECGRSNFLSPSRERKLDSHALSPRVGRIVLVIIIQQRLRSRPGTMWDKSIGNEMNWRNCVNLFAFVLLTAFVTGPAASSANAQARIGEAIIIQNEV